MTNITIVDNGAAFMICANGVIVTHCSSLGDAWRHIVWMYEVATQQFTVGAKQVPVEYWIDTMRECGKLD